MTDIIEANRKHIEAALDHGGNTHTYDDVRGMILTGRCQIWAGDKACAVTEIIVYPRKKVLHCFLAGGDMDQIIDMIDSAIAWGKMQGCESLTLSGRIGWQRVLDKHGFKPVLVTLARDFLP